MNEKSKCGFIIQKASAVLQIKKLLILLLVLSLSGCGKTEVESQLKPLQSHIADTSASEADTQSDTAAASELIESVPSKASSTALIASTEKKAVNSQPKRSYTEKTEKADSFHTDIESKIKSEVSNEFKPIADNGFSGGNGTETQPYIITTPDQLATLSEKVNSGKLNNGVHFALGNDIDMNLVKFTPIGNSNHRFSSCFDGRGYTVSNLTPELVFEDFDNNANYLCGFFGIVDNAEIKNLKLENVNISYTYESNYFTEVGILAACVYTARRCKITDCSMSGVINIENDIVLAGGIIGDVFISEGGSFTLERLQSNTKMQLRCDSLDAGAAVGSVLGNGSEIFSNICAVSEILHNTLYYANIGAFGGVANSKGTFTVSDCFFNTNTMSGGRTHSLIGSIIDSYQPKGIFKFKNVFAFADDCTILYEIPPENKVETVNCTHTDTLPENCGFNTEIWDITDYSSPTVKFSLA